MSHIVQFTLKMFKKRPLRMSLTLLQVAIGVAAITIVLSFVFSVLGSADNSYQRYLLQAEYGKEIRTKDQINRTASNIFSPKLVDAILAKADYVTGASIVENMFSAKLVADGISYRCDEYLGVGDTFARMLGLNIEGNFFSRADIISKNRVVLVSDAVARQLYGKASALGKKIQIGEQEGSIREFTIIGVYPAEKLQQSNRGVHMLLPYSLVHGQNDQINIEAYGRLWAIYKPNKMAEAKKELDSIVKQELASTGETQDKDMSLIYTNMNQDEMGARKQIVKTFGLFLGSFAFVSLVISAMGILSMMLVSIVERTREIGLRRALGASKLSITGQIVVESMLISTIGGFLGVIIAWLAIKPVVKELLLKGFFQDFMGTRASLTWTSMLAALLAVLVIGAIAGIYPGIRAANLVPVEAIREG